MSKLDEALELLREVIGDDDPRSYDTDEQWNETLVGRKDFDHIQISVYAGTLRRILQLVRDVKCTIPPKGWECTRTAPHNGPCAAIPAGPDVAGARCVVCGRKAYLWAGDKNSAVFMRNPRGKGAVMHPTRWNAFCDIDCCNTFDAQGF